MAVVVPPNSDYGVPVQIYIKVLEARGLKGLDKNGVSDPMVELYLGTERRNPLETKVYNKTVTPQVRRTPRNKWHEEFIFTLPDQNTLITLHVWDYVRIFSNVTLGFARFDPKTLVPGTAMDTWLPIEGENGQGELHIFAQSTALQARNPAKSIRLRTFRMILERKVFYPGETIRGALVFNVGVPVKIRGVRVKFEGYTRTHWSESRSRMGPNRQMQTYHVHYSSHFIYFNPTATVYGNPRGVKGDMIIQSGGYFWPFEFVLPTNLAPSYRHSWGENAYSVKGNVDIPMYFDRNCEENLTMTVQYGTLQPVLCTKFSKSAQALLGSNQNMNVVLTAPPVAYMGEAFPLDVLIENFGTKDIKEIQISLISNAYFTAHSSEGYKTRKDRKIILSQTISGMAGFPIPRGGGRWSGQISVRIPPGIDPSIPETVSPLIQVYHTLKARVCTEGNIFTKASTNRSFPILVGERFPMLTIVTTTTTTTTTAPVIPQQPPAYQTNIPNQPVGYQLPTGPVPTPGQSVPFQPGQPVDNPYQPAPGGNPYQQPQGGSNPYQQPQGGSNPYQQPPGGNPYQQPQAANPYQPQQPSPSAYQTPQASGQAGVIMIGAAPTDVYKYLAPGAIAPGQEYNVVGAVVPHDAFVAHQSQPVEQWNEQVEGATAYTPGIAIQSSYDKQAK